MIKYKNVVTSTPEISVHITYREKQSKTILRGYAIKTSDGCRVDGSKTVVRAANCPESVPLAEQYLVSAVMAALPRERSSRRSFNNIEELNTENEMVKTFMLLKENGVDFPCWSEATKNRHMTYFKRNILPVLKTYVGEEFIGSDLDELRKKILDDILHSGRSKQVLSTAETTVNASLAGAAIIYERMREENPSLPDIALAIPRKYKRILPKQVKALPEVVRRRFFVALENLVDSEPKMVFAAVLMADAGLRTSEAAGVLPQQLLLEEDDRITVPVLYQEKQGERTAVLKTESAYRLVPLSYWGSELIRRSCKQIGDVPDDQPLVPTKELSTWILRLLRKCGCDDTFMQSARDAQSQEPEMDKDGRAVHDIAAYVLRRDRTDRWRNCCGLTCDPDGESELDYLLGHQAPHKRRKTNMRLPEQRKALAEKLERYVYNNIISRNPALKPIEVEHGNDIDLTPFPHIRIQNNGDEPLNIHIDVEATEGSEPISLTYPGAALHGDATIRRINTGGVRIGRPIIGQSAFNYRMPNIREDETGE